MLGKATSRNAATRGAARLRRGRRVGLFPWRLSRDESRRFKQGLGACSTMLPRRPRVCKLVRHNIGNVDGFRRMSRIGNVLRIGRHHTNNARNRNTGLRCSLWVYNEPAPGLLRRLATRPPRNHRGQYNGRAASVDEPFASYYILRMLLMRLSLPEARTLNGRRRRGAAS
jgi:hypothetical protein